MEDSSDAYSRQRATAIAEFDYVAKENDEIDLLKGQIIQNIIQKPGGWWEGTISSTGKRGMFPDNFVRVIDSIDNSMSILREQSTAAHRQCKAIYSYARVNDDELTLAVGDIIDFLEEVEEGWWKGKLHNKIGLFPSNFVVVVPNSQVYPSQRPPSSNKDQKSSKLSEPMKDSSVKKLNKISTEETPSNNNIIDPVPNEGAGDGRVPDLPPRPIKEFCRVEFPYAPQNDDELELVVGRIITIVDKELPDKGWWKGTVNGKTGVFPDNFVKLLPNNEIDIPAPRSNSITLETNKISSNSIIPPVYSGNGNGLKCTEPTDTHQSNKKSNQSASNKQSKNMIIELVTQSSTSSERVNRNSLKNEEQKLSIQVTDEVKHPPPLPSKKPIIAGKKSLQTTIENTKQKHVLSQSVIDGGHSSKLQHSEKTINNLNDNLSKDTDFDKVQRVPILSDMRAGRVKAPKRRPPTGSNSLMTESIIKSLDLNTNSEEVVFGSENLVSNCSEDQQIKPKSLDLGEQKVPWIDEFKTRQVKLKSLPNVEPRKTLRNVNNESKTEETKSNTSLITNISTKMIHTEGEKSSSTSAVKEKTTSKTSPSLYQRTSASSIDKNIERESEMTTKSDVKTINKETIKTKFDEIKESKSVQSFNSGVMHLQAKTIEGAVEEEKTKTDSANHEEKITVTKLEHRVSKLEATVQMQQEMIENLMKLLQNETNRVELLKNQLDKYAQCVTQV